MPFFLPLEKSFYGSKCVKMKIGLLTGGGDAPGLNGILVSVTRALTAQGHELIGISDGFEGIFEKRYRKLNLSELGTHYQNAGTFLGTSNKCGTTGREQEFIARYQEIGLDGLVVAGGDGTFSGLKKMEKDIHIIGVPKTIDNDLEGTDITFGYDTACTVVCEAADSLRATAEAHKRVLVVETMGRTAGWIALGGGLTAYADGILLPERPFCRTELFEFLNRKKKSGSRGLVLVVSEGARAEGEDPQVAHYVPDSPQKERYGGISEHLARWIEKELGWESRHVILGHLQRARPPTVTDRFLTLAMGAEAARLVCEKKWGYAAVYRQGRVTEAPITDFMKPARLVTPDHRWVKLAQTLGIFI